ncbi:MAG: hypothetical protein J0G94_06375 [Sphingomonadales bacterium]|nr:hypothetical protein [Sphingomonadales bacterium]
MTNLFNNISGQALSAVLTIVASATVVLGAVGPAYSASVSGQEITAGVAKVPGKSAKSLA